MFLQIVSRPDISFAVNVVSRNLKNPTEGHWMIVKRIFRYLKGTIEMGLLYRGSGHFDVYSDADYANDKKDRKSVSGVLCVNADAAVSWQCKKQQCVSLSMTEAEYISAAATAKELVWFKKLFTDCVINLENYVLYVDNTSAIKLMKNPEFHQRSKHIDVRYHFVRELVRNNVMTVKYVESEKQLAEIFMKALPKPRFECLVTEIGLKRKSKIINKIVKDAEF